MEWFVNAMVVKNVKDVKFLPIYWLQEKLTFIRITYTVPSRNIGAFARGHFAYTAF